MASIVVSFAHRTVTAIFTRLFPTLSHVIDGTVRQILPTAFFASGLFLIAVLALLMFRKLTGGPRAAAALRTSALSGRRFLVTVAIVGCCAGVAFLDAHWAASAQHPLAHLDR